MMKILTTIMRYLILKIMPNISETTIEKAKVYKQYIQGWAYIPPQDLPIYERAYNIVNQ